MVTAIGRETLDLERVATQADDLNRLIGQVKPQVIVNAMAYTAVDRAEQEPDRAMAVNGVAPGVLAKAAQACGACLVHYSSDYVFDGASNRFYIETDPTHPLSVYGQSKLAGEKQVATHCADHLVLRTSWVYGAHGNNFLKTMLRLAGERETLHVVNDQWGAPTGVDLLASTTVSVLRQQLGLSLASPSPHVRDANWGLYHFAAAGETTWHTYAQFVIETAHRLAWPLKLSAAAIQGIAASEYPVAAVRPQNSRLNTQRISDTFGLQIPDWRVGVAAVVQSLDPGQVLASMKK